MHFFAFSRLNPPDSRSKTEFDQPHRHKRILFVPLYTDLLFCCVFPLCCCIVVCFLCESCLDVAPSSLKGNSGTNCDSTTGRPDTTRHDTIRYEQDTNSHTTMPVRRTTHTHTTRTYDTHIRTHPAIVWGVARSSCRVPLWCHSTRLDSTCTARPTP